ncbi:MAG: hypothetical protein FWD52_02240 [Candidatus Bathyarchaeota archaeon]|nr:hypothetical protein [Candidatus Termiticorpusculum sp.]
MRGSKFSLVCFFSKKSLLLISLLFMTTIFVFFTIPPTNGVVADIDIYVYSEAELRDAINVAPNNKVYRIVILEDIVLKKPLEISDNKNIELWSGYSLVGGDGVDTIIVKSGGRLGLRGGSFIVTHAEGASGRGVYVERGGEFHLYGGVISGNSAVKGGGVYNEGVFTLWWQLNAEDGNVLNNVATLGGGVYNVGNFTMYGGWIRRNSCVDTGIVAGVGGGVYNVGTFIMEAGCIDANIAVKGGGVYNVGTFDYDEVRVGISSNVALSGEGHDVFVGEEDVFVEPMDGGGQSYLLPIVGAVAIAVVVCGLFFYRSKRQKRSVVKGLGDSVGEVKV